MKCPRCGTDKIDGKPYCPACGNKYGEEAKKEPDPKATDEYRVSMVLAVFLLIFLVFAFLMGGIPAPL